MASATRRAPGFTLLELLAAMCLMVAVGACLYTSLYTAFTSRRSALIAVEPDTAALNVIELIKQDLYGAMPATGTLAGSFIGTDSRFGADDTDSVEFYTTSVYDGNTGLLGGVAKVELLLEDNERQDNYRLVRKVTTNLLSPKEVEPEEQVLCRNVASLNFRFYDGNDWVDGWDSTEDANSLPLAVEVDIKIAYDDSRASGSASVLSRNDQINSVTTPKEYKLRRLVEAFAIPCGGQAPASTTSSSSGTTGGSSSGGGAGAAGGGGGANGGGG
jgi:type II secretion system protein J